MKTALFCLLLVFILQGMAIGSEDGDYVIGDGDILQVLVWGEQALSGDVTVRPDGRITLPAVGDVPASGHTPIRLARVLQEKLKEYAKNATVTVKVTGITNNRIYVFGGGAPSGVHVLPTRTTLLKFLCRLGNLKSADLKRAFIVREGKQLGADFYNLFTKGDFSKDIALRAEDVIYIPDNELSKIYVIGAVVTPKPIFYREGMRILDAILEAGGFSEFAKDKILILRDGSRQVVNISLKELMKKGDISQNVSLSPGDLVVVKESLF